MASTSHNPSILLRRVLALKESSPFVLVVDSIGRTGHCVLEEVARETDESTTIVYVSFESTRKPDYATYFLEGTKSESKLLSTIQSFLPTPEQAKTSKFKFLVMIDCVNFVAGPSIMNLVAQLASPTVALLAVFHKHQPEFRSPELENYPSSLDLLQFMATSILEVQPLANDYGSEQEHESQLQKLEIPRGLNSHRYKLILTNRRKSGRALTYTFQCDTQAHTFALIQEKNVQDGAQEDPEMFEGLTTFNLNTSNKQKVAKEQVALPFLEAQTFNTGGAIVYEFEKDDDYDEEDPFEDPF
ncbi:LANO_0C08416g1_1 [Lachancea nothofagi CBS 11611]|uniref:Elongator complex protein 5 n=1 Tax=Lachancea nothofagi CBS 11611 TaxID=1266666 RepID=A0A1G4J9A0_9SACH|nr:LANO_0C08416g1_1 [Lachancea nothofagi CBS 11611]